jgi:opine dehydrogenase
MWQSHCRHCALAGAKVRICDLEPFAGNSLRGLKEHGIRFYGEQMNLYGFQREGVAEMEMVTTDVGEAIKGAGIIVIGTTVFGHRPMFERMIPHLEDGQVVMLFPDNFGTLLLHKMMREAGCDKKVIIGGWSSSTYGSRIDMAGKLPTNRVKVYYRAITLRGAAMPASDTEAFIEASRYLPSFDPLPLGMARGCGPVIDTVLSNVKPVLHCRAPFLAISWKIRPHFGTTEEVFHLLPPYCPALEVHYGFIWRVCLALAWAWDPALRKSGLLLAGERIGAGVHGQGHVIPFTDQDPIQYGTGPFTMETATSRRISHRCSENRQLGDEYGCGHAHYRLHDRSGGGKPCWAAHEP